MSWSYSGNPSDSPLDSVRFLIQDTDEDDKLLNDAEIQFMLDSENGDIYFASYKLAETLAGKFSRLVSQTIGDYSISYSDLSEKYLALARKLKDTADTKKARNAKPYAGGISRSDKKRQILNLDRVKPAFKKDLMDIYKSRKYSKNKKGN